MLLWRLTKKSYDGLKLRLTKAVRELYDFGFRCLSTQGLAFSYHNQMHSGTRTQISGPIAPPAPSPVAAQGVNGSRTARIDSREPIPLPQAFGRGLAGGYWWEIQHPTRLDIAFSIFSSDLVG
jgi:hypothetical protein